MLTPQELSTVEKHLSEIKPIELWTALVKAMAPMLEGSPVVLDRILKARAYADTAGISGAGLQSFDVIVNLVHSVGLSFQTGWRRD